jgi:hypothetical protein
MNHECPNCHAVFWKDPGESLGAMYVDYAVATIAFLAAWVVLALTTNLSDFAQMVLLGAIACTPLVNFRLLGGYRPSTFYRLFA